jgi:hypothetical protein
MTCYAPPGTALVAAESFYRRRFRSLITVRYVSITDVSKATELKNIYLRPFFDSHPVGFQ